MNEEVIIDSYIRASNEAITSKQYAQALSYLESAEKIFRKVSPLFHARQYYANLIYCGLALVQSKLHMVNAAKSNLIIAAKYKTNFNLAKTILKSFPLSAVQEIASADTPIAPIAKSIIENIKPPSNIKPPPLSNLRGFTEFAENISQGNANCNLYLDRGSTFFKMADYKNAASDFQIAASLSPMTANIWRRVALCSLKTNQLDMVYEAIKKLQTLGCTYNQVKAELSLLSQKYKDAFEFLRISKALNEPASERGLGLLKYVFGDIKGALRISNDLNSPDDQLISQSLSLLAMPDGKLPSRIVCKSPYTICLKYILNGIYQSLSYSISDVPGSLWISVEGRKTWYSFFPQEQPKTSFTYPDGFNFSMPDQITLEKMLNVGFKLGSNLYPNSINCREKTACGLAYLQLIQSIRESTSYPLLNAIADVIHWLRLVDPLAPLFYRFDMYLIYLKKESFVTELSDYYQQVLEYVKFDLASKTHDALLRDKILSASSADDLFYLNMSNCYSSLPNGASAFIIDQSDHTISFGIYVPMDEKTINRFLSKARPIWARMINMISMKKSVDDEYADFLLYALEWLYEYERVIPLMYYSAIVGIIIFAALLSAYFEDKIISQMPDPMIIQMEALLAKDFSCFYKKMKLILDVKFSSYNEGNTNNNNDDNTNFDDKISQYFETLNIFDLPEVVNVLPTYHHRLMAFLLIKKLVDKALPYEDSDDSASEEEDLPLEID